MLAQIIVCRMTATAHLPVQHYSCMTTSCSCSQTVVSPGYIQHKLASPWSTCHSVWYSSSLGCTPGPGSLGLAEYAVAYQCCTLETGMTSIWV